VILALVPGLQSPTLRQIIVAGLVAAWSLRLGLHIAERSARGPEDARYTALRRDWAARFQTRMFLFLQIQAAAAAVLAASMMLAAHNPAPFGRPLDLVAIAVLAVSIAGEGLADLQMRRFRINPANKGQVCDTGLWAWSRHPNYFFEWLGWVAYPLLAIDLHGSAWGWLALSGPAFMYWLLVYVSGIPLLEQQMLQSRGERFRAYQARVSAFFPLPPKGQSR
jgi:steroid 5-alpha reductase family enzyme